MSFSYVPKHLSALLTALGIATIIMLWFAESETVGQVVTTPSAACHVTDGAFTVCPDGKTEWSDVQTVFFPASNSYLYASQADLDPNLSSPRSPVDTFMLMYDECGITAPLGRDEYFLVAFTTVEKENGVETLEHYIVHIFTDG